MKKVLIISYYFRDLNEIGAVRINGLAKFLPRFGWEPIILTVKSKEEPITEFKVFGAPGEDICNIWQKRLGFKTDKHIKDQLSHTLGLKSIKQKDNLVDKFIRISGEVLAYPDTVTRWKKPAIKLGGSILAKDSIDAIISSCRPFTCHIIAKELKENKDLPWIADFRDLWTQNHDYKYSPIRRFFEKRLELKTLSAASALTTVSHPLANNLKRLHVGKKIYAIPNGFDPLQKNPGLDLPNKFTITYTGRIYKKWQDPSPLFGALSSLISEGLLDQNDLSVEFYGYIDAWLNDEIDKYSLSNVVKNRGIVSREVAIEKQMRSHLLLLLTWNDPAEEGIYTGKLFEYLAAMRPILSIGTYGGVAEQLLNETQSGSHFSDDKELKKFIYNAYLEYKLGNDLSYHAISSRIDKYSHEEMARKFSLILNKLVDNF